jgi:hypothetical protein
MKKIAALVVSLSLSGCVSTPEATPNFINGNYYMGGDPSCARYRTMSDSRIMCLASDGKETGYRDAMTPQQIQMYQHQQMLRQIQYQQELQSTSQFLQNAQAQQTYIPRYQYTPPQVMPITPSGGGTIKCISTGFYTNCRY